MAEKHLVCQGATCKCKYGTSSDKLKVLSQSRHYINDSEGSQKLAATTKDIGKTFEKNTFGKCSKLNNNPCQVTVTAWSKFYKKVTLTNKGNILLEDSKATCPIGSPDCIDIVLHGQTATLDQKNMNQKNNDVLATLCPAVEINDEISKTFSYP